MPKNLGPSFEFTRWLVVFASGVLPAFAQEQARDSCTTQKPPLAAGVNAVHGFYFFIFPRKIDAAYTGCQSVWDQQGTRVLRIRFLNGLPAAYEEYGQTGKATLVCSYSRGATSPEECPPFDDMRGGFEAMPSDQEPQVPKDLDPRR